MDYIYFQIKKSSIELFIVGTLKWRRRGFLMCLATLFGIFEIILCVLKGKIQLWNKLSS
jgi:hypothetical protein